MALNKMVKLKVDLPPCHKKGQAIGGSPAYMDLLVREGKAEYVDPEKKKK